jgi:hypothetical protein
VKHDSSRLLTIGNSDILLYENCDKVENPGKYFGSSFMLPNMMKYQQEEA